MIRRSLALPVALILAAASPGAAQEPAPDAPAEGAPAGGEDESSDGPKARPIGPVDVIEAVLGSDVDRNLAPEQRARKALELYWATLWTERQDALQAAAVARAEAALASWQAPRGTHRAALRALEAWVAAAKSTRASVRAQSGGPAYRLLIGQGRLALDAFPVADLPDELAEQREAVARAEEAAAAARACYEAVAQEVVPSDLQGALALVAAGERLAEQELAAVSAALLARRAHDGWLANRGLLRAHYGVTEPAPPAEQPEQD